jgi:hypothetical protein
VWETPLSRLSKRFGLSDVGLRKICERHNIPTPPIGWLGEASAWKDCAKGAASPFSERGWQV